jgi:hypothetical protein
MQSRAHEAPRGKATVLDGIDGAVRGKWEVVRDVAAEEGVGLAIFEYWLYKLRRERQAIAVRKAPGAQVRLLPVTVRARTSVPVRLEIRVAGVRLRVPVGADLGYVAQLSAALCEARVC